APPAPPPPQGWTDALRHLHPDERIYTFWDYFRQSWQRNAGLRIDHLLLNAEAAPRLLEAGGDPGRGDAGKPGGPAPTAGCAPSRSGATTPRPGSRWVLLGDRVKDDSGGQQAHDHRPQPRDS